MTEDRTTAEREAAWSVLLDTWRTHDLPAPSAIEIASYNHLSVRLPRSERGQVDLWAEALGVGRVYADAAGWYSNSRKGSPLFPEWVVEVVCHLDRDPDKLWSGPVAPSPLVAALSSTVEHLTARPTQDDPFADYGFNPTTPAYTEVEVYDRSPSLATVHLRRVEGGPNLTAAYAFGGTAPAWLAEVPLGTRLLVLCGTDDVVVSGWVEPADLGPAPAPAAPVAVSPERVAEILRALNIYSGTDEDEFIASLDECDNRSLRFNGKRVFSFALLDGTVIRREMFESVADDNSWAVQS